MMRILATTFFLLFLFDCFGQSQSGRPMVSVDTVADLVARKPVPNERVILTGWRTNGDFGAHRILRHVPDSTTATNLGCVFDSLTNGRYVADDCDGAEINAKWFGATGDGVTDDAAFIQAAMDYATNRVTKLPAGTFVVGSTLKPPQFTTLRGAGPAVGYFNNHLYDNGTTLDTNYIRASGRTVLFLKAGANVPMFTNGVSSYFYPDVTSLWDGRGTVTRPVWNTSFEDLTFDGNEEGQTRYDCDLFRVFDCWSFGWKNCYFMRPSGYWLRLWNCNMGWVRDCSFIGQRSSKGILLYDCSDMLIQGPNITGGNIGPSVWLATEFTWFNHIIGGEFGDAFFQNTGGELLSVTTNTMTLSKDPKLETGDPFIFWRKRGGAYPDGLTNGQVYFAIRLATNVYQYSASLPNALAGTGDTITNIGTTVWLKPGPCSAMTFSGATYNSVVGCRFDNSADGCVIFENADYNVVANAIINRSGGETGPVGDEAGLWFREGSGNNQVTGSVFWKHPTAVLADSPNNYLDVLLAGITDTNLVANAALSSYVTYTRTFPNNAKQLLFQGDNNTIPVRLIGTNQPYILEVRRETGAAGGTYLGQSLRSDGLPMFRLHNADDAQPIAGGQGSETNSLWVIGSDFDTRTSLDVRLRPGDVTGTNVAGFNLDIQAGNPTGEGAPGTLLLSVSKGGVAGVGVRSEVTNIVEVSKNGFKANRFASNSLSVVQNLTGGTSSTWLRGDGVFTNLVPAAPTDNGAYVLFVTNGVARWIAHP